jgi:acyl-CoA thioesterase I
MGVRPGKRISNGRGVPVAESWPAKLERALQARGWNVSVSNQGVPGQTAQAAVSTTDARVAPGTNLTIVQFGGNDRFAGATEETIAASLAAIVGKLRAKGSAVIVIQVWGGKEAPAYALVAKSADSLVTWINPLYFRDPSGKLRIRPEFDSGDGEHANAAGTDIIVSRAVPDVESLLLKLGFKPGP